MFLSVRSIVLYTSYTFHLYIIQYLIIGRQYRLIKTNYLLCLLLTIINQMRLSLYFNILQLTI